MPASLRSLQPGDHAPDFSLTAVQADRTVSLADYRARSPLFLGLFRGLYCPFCRRALAQMAASATKLEPLGIRSLAIVATELENARLYFRFRPIQLDLAVDPTLTTHRSYNVPKIEFTSDTAKMMEGIRINPTGELPAPLWPGDAADALNRLDGFQPTEVDRSDREQQEILLEGRFLIDRDGVIRWVNLEGEEGPSGIGRFPTTEELLVAATRAAVA